MTERLGARPDREIRNQHEREYEAADEAAGKHDPPTEVAITRSREPRAIRSRTTQQPIHVRNVPNHVKRGDREPKDEARLVDKSE